MGPAGLNGEVWARPIEPVVIAEEGIGVTDPIDAATDAAGVAAYCLDIFSGVLLGYVDIV